MKNYLFLIVLFSSVLLFSCNSKQEGGSGKSANNNYEQLIADYVQSDKKGAKFDMKFKLISIREIQKDVTVADSIAISAKYYENKNANDILGTVIQCKYSIEPPTLNTKVEEEFYFLISPEGDKCLTKFKKLK